MNQKDFICPQCQRPVVVDPNDRLVHAPPHCQLFDEATPNDFIAAAIEMQDVRKAVRDK